MAGLFPLASDQVPDIKAELTFVGNAAVYKRPEAPLQWRDGMPVGSLELARISHHEIEAAARGVPLELRVDRALSAAVDCS